MKIRIIITEKYPVYEVDTDNIDSYLADGALCSIPDEQLQRWKNTMAQFEEMQKEMRLIYNISHTDQVQKQTDSIGLIG